MQEGVLALSETLTPLTANQAARKLLDVSGQALPPRLLPDSIQSMARRAQAELTTVEDTVNIWPYGRKLRVRANPIPDQGGVIVFLQDVTDELRLQGVRRQFVANASHELKSPVASLQALAEAIAQAASDDPTATRHFADKLVGEGQRLARLIADLLDLSRLEDPANISDASVDLSEVVRSVMREMQELAEAKGLRVEQRVSPGVLVRGDDQQLILLVRNLVDNAIRYTTEGGCISVTLNQESAEVVLEVADDGIGIPVQAQARVFERFYRVDRDRSRERGGTGLGLSIVKHVAELHRGHVQIQSELGEGSTFTVRLPALREGPELSTSPAQTA